MERQVLPCCVYCVLYTRRQRARCYYGTSQKKHGPQLAPLVRNAPTVAWEVFANGFVDGGGPDEVVSVVDQRVLFLSSSSTGYKDDVSLRGWRMASCIQYMLDD